MQKRHIIASVTALTAAALIYLGFALSLDRDVGASFGAHGPNVELLLPSADKAEVRRLRTADGQGGAVDQVQLTSGFSREVHYTSVVANRRSLELTFFPPGPGEERGPLSHETVFARDGLGIKNEKGYDPEHHLIAEGHITWSEEKKEWQYLVTAYFPGGGQKEQELKTQKGKLLNHSQWRENGTLDLNRKLSPYADNSWDTEAFGEDGKTLTWKDQRYYGHYQVIEYWADGKTPKTDSQVEPYSTKYTAFRQDGSKEVQFEVMSTYGISQTVYDGKGNAVIERFFMHNRKKADADGKPVFELKWVLLYDKEGKQQARYDLSDEGKLETVKLFASASRNRVDYHFKGRDCDKADFYDKEGKSRTVENPRNVPVFTVQASWKDLPALPTIPASRISVESEISSGPY